MFLGGFLLVAACAAPGTTAQGFPDLEAPKHEFRGAWIATVLNLDWPSSRSASPANQRTQLTWMLDRLQEAGINAVFFQVRSESDALYDSPYEPWSYWLTGEQGKAPDPFYDPLQFAVEEAHRRGMELHAWFNPYRAVRGSGYPTSTNHVSVQHPEWTLTAGPLTLLNPGLPDVRDHVSRVIADVVRRYDIDGVHFDDYFYPYPPNQIGSQDRATYEDHKRGFGNIGDWRRDNVNLFVAQAADSVRVIDPEVTFGISPFGIWKNGIPSGIVGLNAYNVIYADPLAWLEAETVDYLVPQLYWRFGGGQDYAKLAEWWADQAASRRHLYTGHGLYRSDSGTFSGTLFAADEVPRQVRFNRVYADIQGSVFFRAKNLTTFRSKGFADTLRTSLYRYPALTPPMAWKRMDAPDPPDDLILEEMGTEDVTLRWAPPADSDPSVRRYAVYRVQADAMPGLSDVVPDARNLIAVTGATSVTDRPPATPTPQHYFVTSVSANSIESMTAAYAMLDGRPVSTEMEPPVGFALYQNYPNPFNPTTRLIFDLPVSGPITLSIHNVLGLRVDVPIRQTHYPAGTHEVIWNASGLPSGVYVARVETKMGARTVQLVLQK